MAYLDEKSEAKLLVNARPIGLEFFFTEVNKQGKELIITYTSRAYSNVESRYSQTEREAIAIVRVCKHFHLYLFACKFQDVSNQKPL